MKIVSYYVDKYGIVYQVIRVDDNIQIIRIKNENELSELLIDEYVDLDIERIVEFDDTKFKPLSN